MGIFIFSMLFMEGFGTVVNTSSFSFSGFFEQGGLGLVINLSLLVVILLWIVVIIWVAKDISARTHKLWFQILCVFLVTLLSPIIGLPLYIIIRPFGYLYDKIPWREAAAFNLVVCYNCRTLNHKEYECCVNCGESLKIACKQCGKKYPHVYNYCSACGAPNIE